VPDKHDSRQACATGRHGRPSLSIVSNCQAGDCLTYRTWSAWGAGSQPSSPHMLERRRLRHAGPVRLATQTVSVQGAAEPGGRRGGMKPGRMSRSWPQQRCQNGRQTPLWSVPTPVHSAISGGRQRCDENAGSRNPLYDRDLLPNQVLARQLHLEAADVPFVRTIGRRVSPDKPGLSANVNRRNHQTIGLEERVWQRRRARRRLPVVT